MNCEEFAKKISEHLDGRIPFGKRVGVWFHALLCKPCRRYMRQMRQTVDLMEASGDSDCDEECPDELKRSVMAEFRDKYGDGS